jgi:ATP-binding cassette subfamily F protein 3
VDAALAAREHALGVHGGLIGRTERAIDPGPAPGAAAAYRLRVLLRLEGIGKSFGGRRLLAGVDLLVRAGDRIGLVGPNGVGKTTLLRIAAREDAPDEGRVLAPRGTRIALLAQEIDPGQAGTPEEEAARALAPLAAMADELARLEAAMAEAGAAGADVHDRLAERYDRLRHEFESRGGFEREARVARTLEGLGFDAERRRRPLHALSGGWRMRVELAKLLLSEPDVLLLDEPTNHLDLPSIEWLESTLDGFAGALVIVSHDRAFLARHVNRVAELAPSRLDVYEGSFPDYLVERASRREAALARQAAENRRVAEIERFVERFRYKASKARQVQSRVKALARMERTEVEHDSARRMRLRIPPPERAGAIALRLAGVHKSFGETRVYAGVDFELPRGERAALVGPNGAGKSTLLRMLAGVLAPDRGERTVGHRVEVAFYAQHQLDALDPARTVLEELASVARTDDQPRLRGHLGAFLFSGDDVEKRVSVLSGGEKARLALAKLLLRPANVLVLDEPTNHLDVDACEVLESALRAYQGTLAFISHDRAFINALATRVVEVRAGRLREFLGDYDDYLAKLASEAARDAAPVARAAAAATPAPARTAAPSPAAPAAPAATPSREERDRMRERSKARARTAKRLEAVEAEILAAETALEELGWRLGDPAVFRDAEKTRALEAERETLRAAIAAAYRSWEMLAAELEAAADEA